MFDGKIENNAKEVIDAFEEYGKSKNENGFLSPTVKRHNTYGL